MSDQLKDNQGPLLERLIFGVRPAVLILFALLTVLLGFQASKLRPAASFEKMIPTYHPYIANFLENKKDLSSLGNSVRISVEAVEGDIFSAEYLDTLQKINDEVFLVPGVDRSSALVRLSLPWLFI